MASFFLYKLAGMVVTLPGLLLILMFLAALWAFRGPSRKPVLGLFLLLLACGLTFLSTPLGVRKVLLPLETAIESSLPPSDKDALVMVLSGGLWPIARGSCCGASGWCPMSDACGCCRPGCCWAWCGACCCCRGSW